MQCQMDADGWNIGGTKEYEVFMGGAGSGKMMEPTIYCSILF